MMTPANPLIQVVGSRKLLLASNSPRRKDLLKGLGVDFEVVVLPDIDESFPAELHQDEVALFVAQKKAEAYDAMLTEDTILITADTIVCCEDEIFGKPESSEDAFQMLKRLSGRAHKVITGVVLTSLTKQVAFSVSTDVEFDNLTDEEIDYYIHTFQPTDKAGAYGIQEWIGYVGIKSIRGSYFNVVGLPIQRLYKELSLF